MLLVLFGYEYFKAKVMLKYVNYNSISMQICFIATYIF